MNKIPRFWDVVDLLISQTAQVFLVTLGNCCHRLSWRQVEESNWDNLSY
jgi:hypothetical protein